uniref:Uncharacterized protein n=1 Tax=Vitis vinifera TaxID=29760 RepID=F6HSG1_VITVI
MKYFMVTTSRSSASLTWFSGIKKPFSEVAIQTTEFALVFSASLNPRREKNSRSLTIPALIRYCTVLSIIRISTRPER